MSELLERLTSEQREWVEAWQHGSSAIAGAGSGKTSTLVAKCIRLLQLKSKARIAAVSFTEKAAEELKDRLKLAGINNFSKHWITTIHGLCLQIISENQSACQLTGSETILEPDESRKIWKKHFEKGLEDFFKQDKKEVILRLLERESIQSLENVLSRLREIDSFGATQIMLNSQRQDEKDLLVLYQYILQDVEQFKKENGYLDFADLELLALKCLNIDSIANIYRKRFDLVLVDEFQDTNPIQYKIFNLFSKLDKSNLFIVGDPKQSIYRFRDADVKLFEQASDELLEKGGKEISLSYNFRSRPEIINWVNSVCAPLFKASQLRYDALIASRDVDTEEHALRKGVLHWKYSLGESPFTQAAQLAAVLQSRIIQLDDTVILLKRLKGGGEKWILGLMQAGVSVSISSGSFFWTDPRVREWVHLLRWFYFPENQQSALAFLRAPWVKISDQQIDDWIEKSSSPLEFQKHFFESQNSIACVLKDVFYDQNGLSGSSERNTKRALRPAEVLLKLLEIETLESYFGQIFFSFWHKLEEKSLLGWSNFEIIQYLEDCLDREPREVDVPPPQSSLSIRVMTIHSSKGLEFENVILLDFSEKPQSRAGKSSPLIFWNPRKGAVLSMKDSEGARLKSDPIELEWKAFEEEQEIAESKRLFYVAVTRARERLILVTPITPAFEFKEEHLEQDFWYSWAYKFLPSDSINCLDYLIQHKTKKESKEEAQGRELLPIHVSSLQKIPKEYWIKSKRRISATEASANRKTEESKEFKEGPKNTAKQGVEIHEWIEMCHYMDNIEDLNKASIMYKLPELFSFTVQEKVWQWLQERNSKLLANKGTCFLELGFEFFSAEKNQVLIGRLDRLEVFNDYAIVLDFKWTHAKEEKLLSQYSEQMKVYKLAAKELTGLPINKVKCILVKVCEQGVFEI